MNDIVIFISWEFFLAVMGTLIGIAYYASGRFARLETSIEWLKDTIQEFKVNLENGEARLFVRGSPAALTSTGRRVLKVSGLKAYVDAHRGELTAQCRSGPVADPYELQIRAFRLLRTLPLGEAVTERLNEFSYIYGFSTDLLRRVAAIYLRDAVTG